MRSTKHSFLLLFLLLESKLDPCTSLSGLTRRNALITLSSPLLTPITQADAAEDVTWVKGTQLLHQNPLEAIAKYGNDGVFPMGQWPDPALRISSKAVPSSLFNTDELYTLARLLRNTSRDAQAVGLAAQQCGIDASLIFLEMDDESLKSAGSSRKTLSKEGIFLVNPRFVYRSPETEMLVWEERCLVLPPSFRATTLRDKRVVVEAETLDGSTQYVDLSGEMARAVQHECQHDEGILILDHVDLDEDKYVTEQMREVERGWHEEKQIQAFERTIADALYNNYYDEVKRNKQKFGLSLIPPANAAEMEEPLEKPKCDDACRQRLADRRALAQQSRTTRSRQELFDLSRQRAAMYNTTYQGAACPPGVPCY